ncbi:unnamed protein product [Camellia sinensis]
MVGKEKSELPAEEFKEEKLIRAKVWIVKWGVGFAVMIVLLWPLLSLPAERFSEGYFTFWAIIAIAWGTIGSVVWLEKRYVGSRHTSEWFNTAGRNVKTGLIASVIVSQGGFCCINRYIMPNFFFWGCYMTNIIVMAMLLLGGFAVVNALTGVNIYAASFLIPLGIIVYTLAGGLKATFLASYIHSVIVCTSSSKLGSPSIVYHRLLEVASKSRVCQEPLTHNGYSGGLVFGIINIVGNFGTVFVDNDGELLLILCFLTNIIVMAMLLLGGSAVMNALTGVNIYAASFLIPLGVIVYTLAGGLLGKLHTFSNRYVVLVVFVYLVYTSSSKLGSPSIVYHRLLEVPSKSRVCQEPLTHNGQSCGPVSGNNKGSYLTMLSSGGLVFGIINIVGNFVPCLLTIYWVSAIVARPSSTHKGYLLGGLVWFAVLFSLATSLGLRALALDLPITANEASHGLVPPAIAIALMGKRRIYSSIYYAFYTNAIGAILGTTIGCILGIITWLSVASVEYGRVNLDTTGRNVPTLAGNLEFKEEKLIRAEVFMEKLEELNLKLHTIMLAIPEAEKSYLLEKGKAKKNEASEPDAHILTLWPLVLRRPTNCSTSEDNPRELPPPPLRLFDFLYFEKAKDETLEEIRKMLDVVYSTHYLTLAQTWSLCRLCNAVFRKYRTCHREGRMGDFLAAYALQHLRKGQGVVGRAISSQNLVFCKDVTQFSITEYPFTHYAHKVGLTGSFAICLRSSYIEDNVYVLEFFLPPNYIEGRDPRIALVSLLTTMNQHCKSFKVASGEAGEELSVEVLDFSKDGKLYSYQIPQTTRSQNKMENGEETVFLDLSDQQLPKMDAIDTGNNVVNGIPISLEKDGKLDSFKQPQTARSPNRMENGEKMVFLDLSDQQLPEVDAIETGNNFVSNTEDNNSAVTSVQQNCIINSSQRLQRKAGIPISFEDLQQRFGMKLEDAVESLGVRACREYNITRWSPYKRSKDNQLLSNKLVQGVVQEQILESSQPPISDPPHMQDMATPSCTKPHFTTVQDASIVTIKAKYGDDFY